MDTLCERAPTLPRTGRPAHTGEVAPGKYKLEYRGSRHRERGAGTFFERVEMKSRMIYSSTLFILCCTIMSNSLRRSMFTSRLTFVSKKPAYRYLAQAIIHEQGSVFNSPLRVVPTISKSYFLAFGITWITLFNPSIQGVQATGTNDVVIQFDDISRLKKGLREVNYLLDHWEEKTLYCNFGEFQRDLLTVKNKGKLLVAAAETGLLDYDKSATMNIVCRRDPEVVRAFLGLNSDNNPLLSRAELLMKKPIVVSRVDPDNLEEYFSAVEQFTEAVSAVDSLSYQARTDYSSSETASREEFDSMTKSDLSGKKDYLSQTKASVEAARNALSIVVDLLKL